MIHATKSRVTAMLGGAVGAALLALAAPRAWSQLADTSADAPRTAAITAPASSMPATTAESQTATASPQTKGLHFVTGPADAPQLISDMLQKRPRPLDPNLVGDPATIKMGPVLPIWRLSPGDISAGKRFDGAQAYFAVGLEDKGYHYRYLFLNDGKCVYEIDVGKTDGGQVRVGETGIRIDGEVSKIGPALAKIAAMPEVKAGSYEARYLTLGGIVENAHGTVFSVLWLKADDGGKDLIYPIAKVSGNAGLPGWDAKLYTEDEFFKIAKPLAEQAEQRQNTLPPPGPLGRGGASQP